MEPAPSKIKKPSIQAEALAEAHSWRWLAENIEGIKDVRTLRKRLTDHAWTIRQAEVINTYYEKLIDKLTTL